MGLGFERCEQEEPRPGEADTLTGPWALLAAPCLCNLMRATSLGLNFLIYQIFSKKISKSNTYLMGDDGSQTS